MGNVVVNDTSLQDVANAIREKNGLETKYKPAEMGQAIRDIPSGGKEPVIEELSITENGVYNAPEGVDGYNPISVNVTSGGGDLPPEALVITGNCKFRFSYDGWNWFIENYGYRITTKDITDANNMFGNNNKIKEIPFEINMKDNISLFNYMFSFSNLKIIPKININIVDIKYMNIDFAYMFNYCYMIRNVDNVFDENNLDVLKSFKVTSQYSAPKYGYIFSNCYSLRTVPKWWYKLGYSEESTVYPGYSNMPHYYAFQNCYSIDEVKDIYVLKTSVGSNGYTSNIFSYMVENCNRAKSITFALDNGVPYIVNWKSQTIDLSRFIGYAQTKSFILNYNSGITADKEVTDAESYEALKNDPDWFTTKIEYSRYNHDSAVETINSLPDTSAYLASAGGTNTIKFKGQSGELTDGGAINTLTEEEIAVAAAKGWTVSLV